jgi:hypothetical protein
LTKNSLVAQAAWSLVSFDGFSPTCHLIYTAKVQVMLLVSILCCGKDLLLSLQLTDGLHLGNVWHVLSGGVLAQPLW